MRESLPQSLPESVDPVVPSRVVSSRDVASCPDLGDAGSLVVEERFAIVPEWLLDAAVSDAAVRLYAVLLRFGQTSGARMPSRRLLAGRLRRSTDSVDRAMKELVAVGAVVVERRRRGRLNLTNRYLVRSTRPGDGGVDVCVHGRGQRDGGGGHMSAATCGRRLAGRGSRVGAARVAAGVRPDPEFLTKRTTPPPPTPTQPHRVPRWEREEAQRQRRAAVLAAVGLPDLHDVAARCTAARNDVGRPANLWTEPALVDVLATAVLDRGLPADAAITALLAVAADPDTRSPARLACPGPWWDAVQSGAVRPGHTSDYADLAALEQRLAEADGARVLLQQQAREQLTREGRPVTRVTVARRAIELLDGDADLARLDAPARALRSPRAG